MLRNASATWPTSTCDPGCLAFLPQQHLFGELMQALLLTQQLAIQLRTLLVGSRALGDVSGNAQDCFYAAVVGELGRQARLQVALAIDSWQGNFGGHFAA
jgi:hypothetical protein